jgi:hypothetical protein
MIEKVGFENILICLIIFINFRRFKKENICDIKKTRSIYAHMYLYIRNVQEKKQTNKQKKTFMHWIKLFINNN